jgi:imidazolonepropionase-like amidohydrolase
VTRTVLLCGVLYDGEDREPREDMALVIDGDSVHSVTEINRLAADEIAEAVVFDHRHRTVTPGLIDAHVHTSWGRDDQPGWAWARQSETGRFAWGLAGAQAALLAGVTTVRDCGAPGLVSVAIRDAIRNDLHAGPRMQVCGPCITTTAGHGDFIGVTADDVGEIKKRVRELTIAGVDHIKVMATGGDMDPHTNRRLRQYDDEELAALIADAHRLNLTVVAHCNATSGIRSAVQGGVDTIAHCNWLGEADGTIDYDPEVAKAIVDQGIFIDLNLAATMRPLPAFDASREEWSGWANPPRNRWELHGEIRAAGGNLLFSSDEFGAELAVFPTLLAQAVHQLETPMYEVLHRATAVPAAALRIADTVGRLQPGMKADISVFGDDLRERPDGLENCVEVWQAGRRTVIDGALAGPASLGRAR